MQRSTRRHGDCCQSNNGVALKAVLGLKPFAKLGTRQRVVCHSKRHPLPLAKVNVRLTYPLIRSSAHPLHPLIRSSAHPVIRSFARREFGANG
jgi:hypothetical protein